MEGRYLREAQLLRVPRACICNKRAGQPMNPYELGIVDRVTLQPVRIAHLFHVPQRSTSDADGETAASPGNTCRETKGGAEKAECEHPACRCMPISRIARQRTDTCSDGRWLPGTAYGFIKNWSKRSAIKKCFSTGMRSLKSRIKNLATVFQIRLRPRAQTHRTPHCSTLG